MFSPVVRHTGVPPTGYTVTFRFRAPNARKVQLEGEWYFSSPGHTHVGSSEGRLPSQWRPGDFPIGWPNYGTTAGWPVVDMKKDPRTGVWSYTTPLPSGEFNYDFFVDCSRSDELGSLSPPDCRKLSDPSNPPWNEGEGITAGSREPMSQVYVPSDPAFHTVDYRWQAPTSPHGVLRDVYYPAWISSPGSVAGRNLLAIYTPPGYDPHRSRAYPTVYLSAGYSSSEVDWSTRADAGNILDNLIDKGEIEPMVVVMTNSAFTDCQSGDAATYDQNLLGRVIPYVQSHYRVSRAPARRAFAGLSCGGGLAASLLLHHTRAFGSFGLFSPYPASVSAAQARGIKRVRVMIGVGKQDPIHYNALSDLSELRRAGVEVFADFINGGHDWYVWRILLRDFLTRVAFRPVGG
ncbi:MAG: alpha/beta hydrolase-fold protein [Gaiellaceae bacterium]